MGQKMEAKEKPETVESFMAIASGCGRCTGTVRIPTLRLGRSMMGLGWEIGEIIVIQADREKIVLSRLNSAAADAVLDRM